MYGADEQTRTATAFATAPSRRRVYQFHHIGTIKKMRSPKPTVSGEKTVTLVFLRTLNQVLRGQQVPTRQAPVQQVHETLIVA